MIIILSKVILDLKASVNKIESNLNLAAEVEHKSISLYLPPPLGITCEMYD